MASYKDQLGRVIHLDHPPKRIISLVPSQTELLSTYGLYDQVVGITKFCIHPELWFRRKVRIGGTKTLDIEKILSLEPDLIIANKEENVKEQVEALESQVPVWISDVNNLEEACDMMQGVGDITGRLAEANELITKIRAGFNDLPGSLSPANDQLKCAYLIWRDPYITIGGDTFINDMMKRCHLTNAFSGSLRYPEVTIPDIIAANCQMVLLSSEPYPFKEKHLEELRRALPGVKILLADGEIFSWYGSRLLKAPAYFREIDMIINGTDDDGWKEL